MTEPTAPDDRAGSVDRQRAYELFDRALGLDGEARDDFLASSCAGDPRLLREVKSLLGVAAQDHAPTSALLEGRPEAAEEALVGRTFGRFRLVERIGAGGMGIVFRAERTDGVPQVAAVKLLAGAVTASGYARLQREARLLARVEHPAVARLIDTGTDDGRAWIALEFVRGVPIDAHCERQAVPLRARIELLATLADAVAAAHRMLIVHRDIKPANVLVDESGQPKLIDFGIAAVLPSADPSRDPTVDVSRMFTPNYSAPEQLAGEPVTVATDVFGLGALAYRLLAGSAPYPEASGALRYLLAVSKEEVEPPSVVAARGAAGTIEATWSRRLRGDLDAILCKALARDPAQRYASASDLGADLRRFLALEPVAARRSSLRDRAAKFVRRNAVLVAAGATAVVALAGSGVVYGVQAQRVAAAREIAARRGEFLEKVLESADPGEGRRDITVAETLDAAAAELERSPSADPNVDASLYLVLAQTHASLGRFDAALRAADRAIDLLRRGGGGPLEQARALGMRGEFLYTLDRWSEAEPALRDSVRQLRALHAEAQACDRMLALGALLAHTGREREAEALLREIIDIEAAGGAELRKELVGPYRALAVIYGDRGRYAEAAEAGGQAYELGRRTLAPADPLMLSVQVNYAGVLVNVQRAPEAVVLLRDAIAVQSRVVGPVHRSTLLSGASLSDALYAQGRFEEAAATALPVARELERQFGAENSYALYAWGTYAAARCRAGQPELGLEAMQRVVGQRTRKYPAGDWRIANAEVGLGQCLVASHRDAEAQQVLLRAASALESGKGRGYRRAREAFAALRDLYLATGNVEESLRWKRRLEDGDPPSPQPN